MIPSTSTFIHSKAEQANKSLTPVQFIFSSNFFLFIWIALALLFILQCDVLFSLFFFFFFVSLDLSGGHAILFIHYVKCEWIIWNNSLIRSRKLNTGRMRNEYAIHVRIWKEKMKIKTKTKMGKIIIWKQTGKERATLKIIKEPMN